MALNLVNARARTRGKSPVEFPFKAVGRLIPRKVTDKDGNPILVDGEGKPVKYSLKKVGDKDVLPFELDSQKEPIAPEGTRFVEVDDVESSGITDNLQDVLDLIGAMSNDERGFKNVNETAPDGTITTSKVPLTPVEVLIEWSLDGFNYKSRKNASPVTEQVTEDELTPIAKALVEFKVYTDSKNEKGEAVSAETLATTWRRTVTGTAKLMELDRLEFAKTTPQYKKLIKAGWTPAVEAA